MRAFGRPDALPAGDLVLRRMTGAPTAYALERQSEAWRPWRAYAVMLLWQAAGDARSVATDRRRSGRISHAGEALPQTVEHVRGARTSSRSEAGPREQYRLAAHPRGETA
jgi:hypothetical protein